MQRLILVLLAFLALFTFIRAFNAQAAEKTAVSIDKPVEIVQ